MQILNNKIRRIIALPATHIGTRRTKQNYHDNLYEGHWTPHTVTVGSILAIIGPAFEITKQKYLSELWRAVTGDHEF